MTRWLSVSASVAVLLLSAAPTLAQTWQARDGAAEVSNGQARLAVMCADNGVSIRFAPASATEQPSASITVQIDPNAVGAGGVYSLDAVQAADGSLVGAAPGDGRLIADLRSGSRLWVGADGITGIERFSLGGSDRAIGAVLAECDSVG